MHAKPISDQIFIFNDRIYFVSAHSSLQSCWRICFLCLTVQVPGVAVFCDIDWFFLISTIWNCASCCDQLEITFVLILLNVLWYSWCCILSSTDHKSFFLCMCVRILLTAKITSLHEFEAPISVLRNSHWSNFILNKFVLKRYWGCIQAVVTSLNLIILSNWTALVLRQYSEKSEMIMLPVDRLNFLHTLCNLVSPIDMQLKRHFLACHFSLKLFVTKWLKKHTQNTHHYLWYSVLVPTVLKGGSTFSSKCLTFLLQCRSLHKIGHFYSSLCYYISRN